MALIKCIECGKEISDKAISCPNCGCPIEKSPNEEISNDGNVSNDSKEDNSLEFPQLPTILNAGKQIVNWGFDAGLEGGYYYSENVVHEIPEGDVKIALHTNGVCIWKGTAFYYISDQQIINISTATEDQIMTESKSIIGRAIVGGLILGPLGAVIGGMSGVGSKQKLKGKYYLIINFWDLMSQSAQTLLISTKIKPDRFIDRYKEERTKNNIPEGSNAIIYNIFKSNNVLSDDRIIEAVKNGGLYEILPIIKKLNNYTDKEAYNYIQNVASEKNVNIKEFQKGCLIMLPLLGGSLLGVIAAFIFLLSH